MEISLRKLSLDPLDLEAKKVEEFGRTSAFGPKLNGIFLFERVLHL